MEINLASFLAAIIDESGGEVRVSYPAFLAQNGEKSLTIALSEDGQELILGLINVKDIPEDVE